MSTDLAVRPAAERLTTAADLPAGSIVATTYGAYIKEDAGPGGYSQWAYTGGPGVYLNAAIDRRLATGSAVVVRTGYAMAVTA